jgi:hypothetical protein
MVCQPKSVVRLTFYVFLWVFVQLEVCLGATYLRVPHTDGEQVSIYNLQAGRTFPLGSSIDLSDSAVEVRQCNHLLARGLVHPVRKDSSFVELRRMERCSPLEISKISNGTRFSNGVQA